MASKKKRIIKVCHKRFEKIQMSYEKYYNNPYVPSHVHRLRVNMRKLRAMLNFLKPALTTESYNKLNQTLSDIGKMLSPLRDLDVFIEECTKLAYQYPQLIDNYADVFRFLEKERLKLIKKVSAKKAFKEIEELLTKAHGELNDMTITVDDLEDFIQKRFEHKTNKLEKQYSTLDKNDYEAVHETRKQAKKVRYTAIGLKKVLGTKDRKIAKKNAKKIQNKLGEITDTHVMKELLETFGAKTTNEHLKASFEKLGEIY